MRLFIVSRYLLVFTSIIILSTSCSDINMSEEYFIEGENSDLPDTEASNKADLQSAKLDSKDIDISPSVNYEYE